jgi:hypothetical protein
LRKAKKKIYCKKCTSVRELARIIGKLSATRIQFSQASLYLRQLSNSMSSTVNQWGWDTYYLWEYKIIGETKWWQRTIKSSYFDNLKSSSSDYDKCIPNSMGSDIPSSRTEYKNKRKKRNKKIISRREKSSNIIGKSQSILPHKFNDFQVEL